jgi:hypothetical protein
MEKRVLCLGVTCRSKFVQTSMRFATRKIHICSYKISEVPTSRFHVQLVMEALEGSVKARGTVSSEGGFHPLGYVG